MIALWGALGCNPDISSLDPAIGHDRALVVVVAPPIFPGFVIWNPGTNESWRAGGMVGQMFTVPGDATVGSHSVQRGVAGIRGSQARFTVDEVRDFPRPRVDRVSLFATEFRTGGTVATLLYIQGANVDVGAAIELEESSSGTSAWNAIPAMAHRGLSNRTWDETLGLPFRALDYPIYHFLTFLAVPGERPPGEALRIRIRNEDGTLSEPFEYRLPLTAADLDSDGDGIPDQLESGDAKYRPDIFLQIDHMEDAANPLQHPWSHDIATTLQQVFAVAPIITPIGPTGINLVIDDAQAIPRNVAVYYPGPEDPAVQIGACTSANIPATDPSLRTLKRACFDNTARGTYWHYCVWAGKAYYYDFTGAKAFVGGFGEIGGDDCIIGADHYADAWMADVRTEAELLTHELGHNLGLLHGGADNTKFNPAYNSVMSYSWLGRNHWQTTTRKGRPVCTTLYYQLAGASDADGTVPTGANPGQLRGYSDGMGRALSEKDLDEKEETTGAAYGVCNNPVDWDCARIGGAWQCDDDFTDLNVSRDLNDNSLTTDTFADHADWVRMIFNGPALNGSLKLQSDPP